MERLHPEYPPVPAANRAGLFADTTRSRTIRFSAALSMRVEVQASVRLKECDDSSCSRVALDGAVVLAGLSAAFSFGRGARLSRLEDDRFMPSAVMLIPPGEWFTVASADARAAIFPGAPVRIRFHDGDGARISETYNLGPCSGEPRGFALSFHVPVAVTVEITAEEPGVRSTITGTLVFLRGILARCLFPQEEAQRGDGEPLVGTAEAVAIPIGQTIRFPEQLMPRTPANSLRALSFLDGWGRPLGRFVPRSSRDPYGAHVSEI